MYTEAVSAAERAMSNSYHALYSTGNPDVDYTNLFNWTGRASRNAANKEVLLAFICNYDLGEAARTSHNLSRECWVPGDYARFVPTNSMIEAYLTDDGKIWDPSGPVLWLRWQGRCVQKRKWKRCDRCFGTFAHSLSNFYLFFFVVLKSIH